MFWLVSEEDTAMRHILRSRPVLTEEGHRATTFEIFFDLVFVFALTRVLAFMAQPPTPLTLAQGLVLLLLLWRSFVAYAWLGNQVRADVGLIRAGMLVAMAAIFVAAMVMPDAWRHGNRTVGAPLTLALAYIVVRAVHLALYLYVAADNPRLRTQVLLTAFPAALGWILLIVGAVLDGTAQTLLWAAAFVADLLGAWGAATYGGSQVRSPTYFAERHGLVLNIALGESLIAAGSGAGSAVTRWPVPLAALLGLTAAVCLWWLYFENASAPAVEALRRLHNVRRVRTAANGYSLAHFPLIAGVIYLALGIYQVLANVAHNGPGHLTGASLGWTSTTALYGGVVLYLVGRILFLRSTTGHASPAQIVAAGIALLLLPVAEYLRILAALGLLTALLVALVCYERFIGTNWSSRATSPPS
jgi:low temperature requirement protein LtrA